MTSQSARFLRKGLFINFALLFFPVAVLLSAVIWPVIQSYEKGRISIIKARESGYLNISKRLITSEFNRSLSDLRAFIRDPLLLQYIDGGMKKYRKELSQLLSIHSEGYRRYDQIRLLDTNGQEVTRVNYQDGHAIVVTEAELQNKRDRYYFSETNSLKKGDVYVSPIDLNIEHGKIELPYKPTIRFAAPLFDRNGKRQGVIVLNYLADILLNAFHHYIQHDPFHQAMLLNSDGYWISHPNPKNEWGFMLGRDDLCFATEHPTAWEYIKNTSEGEFETPTGLLLFTTIVPLIDDLTATGSNRVNTGNSSNYNWKVVLQLPTNSLYATSFIRHGQGKTLLTAIYFLLALLAFLIAVFFQNAKQRREEEKTAAAEIEDLYNLAPCGYHSLDHNGLIVKMNQTELNWLNYSAEELVGKKRYTDILTPDSQEIFRNKFPEFLQQGSIHDVELDVIRKDGSPLSIMVSATAVKDSHNNIVMSRSTVFDMTDRKKLEQRLKQQATTDFLTGLNNRRNFYYLAEVELIRTQRSGKPVSVLLIDIDHFKKINDTHGHEAGDRALQTFSLVCREELREIDILGRVGGEEFAALLPETDGKTAVEVAHRLCKAVMLSPISVSSEIEVKITASIGITKHMKSDRTIHDMLKRADHALYTAKKSGRNQVCYEDPDTDNDLCSTL